MTEIKRLLDRQARWQKARKDLSWPEKIRMAERIRASVSRWRTMVDKCAVTGEQPKGGQAE